MVPDNMFHRPTDERLAIRSVVGAFAVVAAAFLFSAFASVLAFSLTAAESVEALQSDPVLYAVVNGLGFLGFIAAAVGYLAFRDEWDVVHTRSPRLRDAGWVVVGLVLLATAAFSMSAVVSVIIFVLEEVFGVATELGENSVITTGESNPTVFLYMIPVSILLVGPGEELVFRGVVQGLFRRTFGVVPGVLLASLLFGMGHYFAIASGAAWTYIFIAAGMGIALGAVYEYTENILVPMAIHGIWNAFLFVVNWYLAVNEVQLPA